jgi:hypothetical protein
MCAEVNYQASESMTRKLSRTIEHCKTFFAFSTGILDFNSGCGCWQVFGWYISQTPWEGTEDTYISIDAEWSGPCETCNAAGEDETINSDCPECDGEGYTQDYFD